MDPHHLEQEFVTFVAKAGVDLRQAPVLTGFTCMLRFFGRERADGCEFDDDADMLLFQWGVYDWGEGPMFELDLTRQVMVPGEVDDDAIWQLHLRYRYTPTPELAALGEGSRWCHSTSDLPAFEEFIHASPALAVAATLAVDHVDEFFECAG